MILTQDKLTENQKVLEEEKNSFYRDLEVDFSMTYTSSDDESKIWVDPTTSKKVFDLILHHLPNCKNYTFLDCGSGLGHVIYLSYPFFKKVIGIEKNNDAFELSKRNLKTLLKDNFKNISLVNKDLFEAKDEIFDETNVFYISSPFRETDLFEKLIKKIVKSINNNNREIWLIYYYPYREDIILKYSDFFGLEKKIETIGTVNIYHHKH